MPIALARKSMFLIVILWHTLPFIYQLQYFTTLPILRNFLRTNPGEGVGISGGSRI